MVNLRQFFSGLFWVGCAGIATAGNFSITPVKIYMTPRDRAVAVTIENEDATPLVVQAEGFAWAQSPDGKDKLMPTEDLIISPPIIQIPPKGRQIVRLARVGVPDLANQQIYRLVVSEVPEAGPPKTSSKDGKVHIGLEFYLAMSMPVFITPPAAKPELVCQFGKSAKAELVASCKNTGTAYAQIRQMTFLRSEKKLGDYEVGAKYLLPGASQSLALKPVNSSPATLSAGPAVARLQFDDGKTLDLNIQIP